MRQKTNSVEVIAKHHPEIRLNELSAIVRNTFDAFGVSIEIQEVKIFPDGLCFFVRPTMPVRMHVIRSFEDDLRFALENKKVEIIAPIPNEQMVGITVLMDVEREIYGRTEPGGIPSPWSKDMQLENLYEEARQVVVTTKKVSVSFLQRKFNIGSSRAGALMDLLEERGVIGPDDGSGHRQIYPDR